MQLELLTCVNEDFDENISALNHLVYGRNINKKCFSNSTSADMNKTDAQNTFQHMKLVLQNLFNRFEKDYYFRMKRASHL